MAILCPFQSVPYSDRGLDYETNRGSTDTGRNILSVCTSKHDTVQVGIVYNRERDQCAVDLGLLRLYILGLGGCLRYRDPVLPSLDYYNKTSSSID